MAVQAAVPAPQPALHSSPNIWRRTQGNQPRGDPDAQSVRNAPEQQQCQMVGLEGERPAALCGASPLLL